MDADPLPTHLFQPALFNVSEPLTGALELFPAVWRAAEELIAPEAALRLKGLEQLVALDAHRLSPLVAYLVATRLADPDLAMRRRVVMALGELLGQDPQGLQIHEQVRQSLLGYLSQMRTRVIYALLECAVTYPDSEIPLARVLNANPFAGRHLADILAERKNPLALREKAALMIGLVGYLEALPALERLAARLEVRLAGQQSMPFAPPSMPDEVDLLPALRSTLMLLRAP